MMTEFIIGLCIACGLIFGTLIFATHMTIYKDYTHYKPTYNLLNQLNDGSKIAMLNDILTINLDGYPEIMFFSDDSFKILGCDTYIHNSIFMWFSPYGMYYRYKFKKLKPHLVYLYRRYKEENHLERYYETTELVKSKELYFKFFRG